MSQKDFLQNVQTKCHWKVCHEAQQKYDKWQKICHSIVCKNVCKMSHNRMPTKSH